MTTKTLPSMPSTGLPVRVRAAVLGLTAIALLAAAPIVGLRLFGVPGRAPGFVGAALELTTIGDLPLNLSLSPSSALTSCAADDLGAVASSGSTDLVLAFGEGVPIGTVGLGPEGLSARLDLDVGGSDLTGFIAEEGSLTRTPNAVVLSGRFADPRGRSLFVAARFRCPGGAGS